MKSITYALIFIIQLYIINYCHSQSLPHKSNLVDENGLKQGDWAYYYDKEGNLTENNTITDSYQLVTYENGKPVGKVREYFRDGQILVEYDSITNEDPLRYEGMQKVYSEEGNLVSFGYVNNGQMDTAFVIQKFKQIIDTYKQEIPDHLDLAYTANNLAYLYLAQRRYDSAEVYYRIAKEIREKKLGLDDVVYANSCNKLGFVLLRQGKLKEAEPLYKISLRVHGQILGKESNYYVGARDNLAYIYLKTGQYQLAEPLYREAVEMKKTNNNQNKSYNYYWYQLARVYAKLGDWHKALDAYLNAKNITEISKENMFWFVELLEE